MKLGLEELRAGYKAGKISKADYINRMHEIHASLFEYADFAKNTDATKIEIENGQVIVCSKPAGIKTLCDREDKRIIPLEILNFGAYEPEEIDMTLSLIKKGAVVLDIGANIGWYSMTIARLIPSAIVYAFEPIPKTYSYLKQNLKLNNLGNVKALNFGLSNKNAKIIFNIDNAGLGNASAVNLTGAKTVKQVPCQIKKLDHFAKNFKKIDFIKCDVEGGELLVFAGGQKVLQKHKPIIFTEMLRKWSEKFNYHPNDIIKLLTDIGYGCFVNRGGFLKPFYSMNEQTKETNFFFLHKEKHKEKINKFVK